jgi:hypothetical protein
MNMGKKDLDSWGREKASKRYADGGLVEHKGKMPLMEHPGLPAARDRLRKEMIDKGNSVPRKDIDNPSWRTPGPRREIPGTPAESRPGAFGRDEHLMKQGLAEIKRGGRIKK